MQLHVMFERVLHGSGRERGSPYSAPEPKAPGVGDGRAGIGGPQVEALVAGLERTGQVLKGHTVGFEDHKFDSVIRESSRGSLEPAHQALPTANQNAVLVR